MPVFPGLFEKISLLRNDEPGFLLDMSGTQGFRALCTAHKLGIFECLDPHPLTAKEVASRLNLDPRGTGLLLEALEALGYLEDNGDKYCNSKIVKKWLLKDSPSSFSTALPLYSSLFYSSFLNFWSIQSERENLTLHCMSGSAEKMMKCVIQKNCSCHRLRSRWRKYWIKPLYKPVPEIYLRSAAAEVFTAGNCAEGILD